MVTLLSASSEPLSSAYDVLLLDLDGTTYVGRSAAPHAPQALACAKKHGARTMYLTNNSGRSPHVVAQHLTSLGITTTPDEVINSSYVAAREAERLLPENAKVLLVGAQGLHEAFEHTHLTIVSSADDCPDAVIQGLDERATWASLSEAVLALTSSASVYIATNLDATLPKERGAMIGNGSLVACIENATGATAINCGKPEPLMYQLGVERAYARKPLSVGDRLDTDIAGALAAGYQTMHVLTGVAQPGDVMLAPPEQRPSFLGIDLRDVNTAHSGVHTPDLSDLTHAGMRGYICDGDLHAHRLPIFQSEQAYAHVMCDSDHAAYLIVAQDSCISALSIELSSGALRRIPPCVHQQCDPEIPDEWLNQENNHVNISLPLYRAATCALWNACDDGIISSKQTVLPKMHVYRIAHESSSEHGNLR